MAWGDLCANLGESWGALRILKTIPEWSRMVVSVVNVPVYTFLGVSGELSGGGPKRVHGVSWDGLESSWIHSGVSLGILGGFIWGHLRVLCARVYVRVCICGVM